VKYFRIYPYFKFFFFLKSFFFKGKNLETKIKNYITNNSGKNFFILTSQLRSGFFILLEFLLKKNPEKNEIILSSFNLAEMANISRNLKLKLIFPKLKDNLFIDSYDVKKRINNKTLAILCTNFFNTTKDLIELKRICREFKIPLIEDNAIYFDNFKEIKKKKIYSGSFGDYSLYSFNIMKNISAMYGGGVSTNDKGFIEYANLEIKDFKNFFLTKFLNQCLVYLILKIISINFIYNLFFFKLISRAHKNNNNFLIKKIYPSLKFKKENISSIYKTKIRNSSIKMIYLQLKDHKNRQINHMVRKFNNYFYEKCFLEKNIKRVKIIKIKERDFQNYNDYPIFVKKKKKLVKYLFSKGIETKVISYKDCQNLFNIKKKYLKLYEDQIICLPNHKKITKPYIDYIVNSIHQFYYK